VPADGETTDRSAQLQRGRAAVARSDWAEAYDALSRAQPLGADDLQLLATAAYLLGRLPESVTALRSACEAFLAADEPRRAARAVFWMVFLLGNQGQAAQAAGWLARAEHLLADQPADCAVRRLSGTSTPASTHRRWNRRGRPSRSAAAAATRTSSGWL